ncbi:MAG: hypothetical protein IJ742_05525 [Prevotella sp.]|nr:hypothetical protein [Prevotella sp.]
MKNLLLLFTLILSISASAQQRQISHVDISGSWYHVYDTNGKRITTLANSSVGELVGWSGEIIVTKSGAWYKIIDPQGKTIKIMAAQTVGTVISVAGNTFTSRSGNWLHTWDKTGKRLSSRAAN